MKEYLLIDACQFGPNYNYCLLEALAHKGEKVVFATTEFVYDRVPDPPDVKVFKCFFFLTRFFKGLASSRNARRFLRAIEYPVNLCFLLVYVLVRRIKIVNFIWVVSPQLDYLVIKILQFMGRKVVYTAHNSFPHEQGDKQINSFVRIYRAVDHIITLTEYTKRDITNHVEIRDAKITVIPHGDYASLFSRYKIHDNLIVKVREKAAGRKVIAFMGLIRPYKGLDVFIEAIGLIK